MVTGRFPSNWDYFPLETLKSTPKAPTRADLF
jgi:hypothetical protein